MKKLLLIISINFSLFFIFSNVQAFEIMSPSFENGKKIPKIHVCGRQGGKDISIPVMFRNLPEGTTVLAIIIDDPDAKSVAGKTWVHFVLSDIPIEQNNLKPIKSGKYKFGKIGRNSSGSRSYQGMCPPNGKHVYRIAGFALSEPINKKLGSLTIERFEKKYKKIIISKSQFTGWWK
ncbi:MAG: YbhB/YbcL family Raf kinase inhibitor-like protein [Rhodospirillaceae bacterium]|nr:YbhB/YbcL family Raf kinase inhibitor-like protein [Rhodospirillaceae bacterium]|tara:strand:+ start:961 stop:1491 length:531 start_codon:yes stop_codon:yes gene_type:complete